MKPTISLTFDDGLRVQREHAIPELDRRGLRATFFLIASDKTEYNSEFHREYWMDAAQNGHEIGSHSVNHLKAASLTPAAAAFETGHSKRWLEDQLMHTYGPGRGVRVKSFCYPYTDAPQLLQNTVRLAGYGQARGGRGARPDKYLVPGDGVNLLNTPCFHVGPETIKDAFSWITETVNRKAWLTLMFHGVGPDNTQWDNISTEMFADFLDMLYASPVQVTPYGEAAEEYRRG